LSLHFVSKHDNPTQKFVSKGTVSELYSENKRLHLVCIIDYHKWRFAWSSSVPPWEFCRKKKCHGCLLQDPSKYAEP
jgi:hypothetical protein